jgi:hypothetical protein
MLPVFSFAKKYFTAKKNREQATSFTSMVEQRVLFNLCCAVAGAGQVCQVTGIVS